MLLTNKESVVETRDIQPALTRGALIVLVVLLLGENDHQLH